jgi:hypothetical protein
MRVDRRLLLWVMLATAVGFLAGILARGGGWSVPIEAKAAQALQQIRREAQRWQDSH